MVIRRTIVPIALITLIAQPAFGMRVPTALGNVAKRNVAQYLGNKAARVATPKLSAAPVQVARHVSNLGEFKPLSTYNLIKDRFDAVKFTVQDALEIYKSKYTELATNFAEVATAIYSPSNIIEFMARNNIGKSQMSLEVAKTTKEFITETARYINDINRQLAQDLKSTELGAQTSEQITKLKADAQIAINQVQTIANKTIASLQATYAQLTQDAKQTALDFAKLNRNHFDKIAQDAAENPKASRGLFAATLLAGTAGYMGYEANQQSTARKERKAESLIETAQVAPVITEKPVVEVAPVIDFEIEQAKRELAEADALWQANQALLELEIASKKPVITLKNGELAIGSIGFKPANIPGCTKAQELAASAYTDMTSLATKVKTNLTDNRVVNYLGSTRLAQWFNKK